MQIIRQNWCINSRGKINYKLYIQEIRQTGCINIHGKINFQLLLSRDNCLLKRHVKHVSIHITRNRCIPKCCVKYAFIFKNLKYSYINNIFHMITHFDISELRNVVIFFNLIPNVQTYTIVLESNYSTFLLSKTNVITE